MEWWVYRVRVWNKSGNRFVEATRFISDDEYAFPEIREAAEQKAEDELDHTEGVTDDMKRVRLGWVYKPFPDTDEGDNP